MNEDKEIKCIYCGKGVSDGIQLSESDIIPRALTNKRIINKCVCKIKHNSNFSDDFESKVINDLAFIRNRLGMFGANTTLPRYQAKYNFGDITLIKKQVSNRDDLFDGKIIPGFKNGEQIKFGNIENLKKIKKFDYEKFIDVDFDKYQITEDISFCLKTLFCEEALRLAAKVGYEWYCKQNDIKDHLDEYDSIISYIESGIDKTSDIVEIVVNLNLYNQINSQIELGGHALSIIHSSDRNIYVLFFFSVL
jgi:hypothetical protein